MEIRDPIHGSIKILDQEVPIIEHQFFQRLRNIKQLGLSEYAFPGATHTRYIHSIGVMHLSTKIFGRLFPDKEGQSDWKRLEETLRLSCLLHDIGHAPLSHSTESVMPLKRQLNLPPQIVIKGSLSEAKATHEDYTIKAITDSELSDSLKKVTQKWGVDKFRIAELIYGQTNDPNYFTIDGINYFPILHQLVSSEMDCDRMDYLLRDSYFCGVSYGHFDLDWIQDNLQAAIIDNQAYLGITQKAVPTFDDFLLARFHMFLMVYYHYRAVCLEQLLLRYFETSNNEYEIPANIESYQNHDDHYLMRILRSSQNSYAKDIVRNVIPPKVFETFGSIDEYTFKELENYLRSIKADYFTTHSEGRLSKYYDPDGTNNGFNIQVVCNAPGRKFNKFLTINEATDLFQKYSQAHRVGRIYCYTEQLSSQHKKAINQITQDGQLKS